TDMIAFQKGLKPYFPIAIDDLRDMGAYATLLQCPTFEVVGDDTEIVLQWPAIQIEIDEDKASPAIGFDMSQLRLGIVQLWKIPGARQLLQCATEAIGPTMI